MKFWFKAAARGPLTIFQKCGKKEEIWTKNWKETKQKINRIRQIKQQENELSEASKNKTWKI